MSRRLASLTAVVVAALAATASGTPTPSFSVSGAPTVGAPVTFDASATICDAEPCGYTWRVINGTRLGITFGQGPLARYTFSKPGPAQIELRVVNSNARFGGPSPREVRLYRFITVAPASAPDAGGNTAPDCPDLTATVEAGSSLALPGFPPCTDADGDALDPRIGGAQHGTLVAAGDGSGATYTPAPGFAGTDTITYDAQDVFGLVSRTGTLTLTVTAPPSLPIRPVGRSGPLAVAAPRHDLTAPSFTFAVATARLKELRSGGMRLTLVTDEGGAAAVTVTGASPTPRRREARARLPVVLGSLREPVSPGRRVLAARLTPAARRALKATDRARLLVHVRVVDAAGNGSARTLTVTLGR
jgi:hypothetical protein